MIKKNEINSTYNYSHIHWESGFIKIKHECVQFHMNQIYDIRNSTKWNESFPA